MSAICFSSPKKYSRLIIIIAISFFIAHCSSAKKTEVKSTPPQQSQQVSPAVTAQPSADSNAQTIQTKPIETKSKEQLALPTPQGLDTKKATEKNNHSHSDAHAPNQPAEAHKEEHHGRKVGDIAPDKAMGWLKNGNTRYLKGFLRKDGSSPKDIQRLSTGQAPHSIIVSCSDSRVPPEIVFDQKLGEVFVVRSAGQSLDNATLASIEYAVEHLGSNLIVVMGHTSCGAVKAAFTTPVGGDTGSPYINALVSDIQPRIATRMKSPASDSFVLEGWDNAKGVARDIMEKSKIVREAVKSGTLRVESTLYHLKSGQVEWATK